MNSDNEAADFCGVKIFRNATTDLGDALCC